MQQRLIAGTDLQVSVIGMGCWPIAGGPTWGAQNLLAARQTIRTCLDCGINYFDTAELYGNGDSEALLGEELRCHADEVVIASKVIPEHADPVLLRRSCEDSLRRLRREWIDIYHVHWPVRAVPADDVVETLQALREEGKIREMAVSNFGPEDLRDFLAAGGMVPLNQLPYSLLFRAIEYEVLPASIEAGAGVICYGPLQQGLLTGKWQSADEVPQGRARTRLFAGDRPDARHGEGGQEALLFRTIGWIRSLARELGVPMHQLSLAWLLARTGVVAAIPGMRNSEQVREAAAAAYLALPEAIVAELTGMTDELKGALGGNPDLWESTANSRFR